MSLPASLRAYGVQAPATDPPPARLLVEVAAAGLLALLAGPSPIAQRIAADSLAAHMLVEHYLLIGAGALGGHALLRLCARFRPPAWSPGWRLAGLPLFFAVLVVWHAPEAFGAALTNPTLHAVMHLSYMAAGAGLVAALPLIGAFGRLLILLALQSVMAMLALAMYTGAITYPGYDAASTATAGVAMLVGMQIMFPVLAVGPWLASLWRRDLLPALAAGFLGTAVLGSWLWP